MDFYVGEHNIMDNRLIKSIESIEQIKSAIKNVNDRDIAAGLTENIEEYESDIIFKLGEASYDSQFGIEETDNMENTLFERTDESYFFDVTELWTKSYESLRDELVGKKAEHGELTSADLFDASKKYGIKSKMINEEIKKLYEQVKGEGKSRS